jgi:hypothetical protein
MDRSLSLQCMGDEIGKNGIVAIAMEVIGSNDVRKSLVVRDPIVQPGELQRQRPGHWGLPM